MIEEGVRVLYESGAIESPLSGADRELVKDIYLAMRGRRASPTQRYLKF
jgi:hypothetical protein